MARFNFLRRAIEFLEDRLDDLTEVFTPPPPPGKRSPKQNRRSKRTMRKLQQRAKRIARDVVEEVIPSEPDDIRPFANLGIFDTPNTYPDHWVAHEKAFFDSEPNTYRALYSQEEWDDLQDGFYRGWLETGLTKPEHEAGRQLFYDISGVLEESFDWEAYRAYIDQYVSPPAA